MRNVEVKHLKWRQIIVLPIDQAGTVDGFQQAFMQC